MAMSRFTRPKGFDNGSGLRTPNLYVANCGPCLGLSYDKIRSFFGTFGEVTEVHPADESGARVIVCFSELSAAQAALEALNNSLCAGLGGRILHVRYSVTQMPQKVSKNDSPCVSCSASELSIPGIFLVHDYITEKEEQELLAAVGSRPWKSLSKRRVQHYGYEFLYETRNVDSKKYLGELPSFLTPILKKLSSFPGLRNECISVDQLTVNEYPSGVGLSPHIDTHSAFDEFIFSLSTAGPCIMEFRKCPKVICNIGNTVTETEGDRSDQCTNLTRKIIFLPPRSMLLMSGEGRYAWQHYIPHHKVDMVRGHAIRRSQRRVSFTFRKVRREPCCCEYKMYCDSQGDLP